LAWWNVEFPLEDIVSPLYTPLWDAAQYFLSVLIQEHAGLFAEQGFARFKAKAVE